MRILGSLSVVALALASRSTAAQLVENSIPAARIGLVAGLNMTKFSGDGLGPTDNRNGFVGGLTLVTPFTPVFSTQLDLLYAMKGMKSLSSNPANYAVFKLDYLEIPVMLRADLPLASPVKPFAFTGPVIDFQVSCSGDEVTGGKTISATCKEIESAFSSGAKFQKLDYGWVLGGGLGFDYHNRRISVGARYELGLRSVLTGGSSKNRALSLMASVEAPLPRKTRRQ